MVELFVVSHTHWDREWYLPFERFRMRLVRMVDSLVSLLESDPTFRHFMLDGQTSVVEDYLEVRPEMRGRIEALVRSGRLGVGPWYVLPDEFLVSGESLVRNLALGRRAARELGRSMEVLYAPDQFGHIAQLPEIGAGFGLQAAVVWRGLPREVPGDRWRWRALSGTELFCLWLPAGYGNGAKLPADPPLLSERIRAELARIEGFRKGRTVVLMNGSDHLGPDAHVPRSLVEVRPLLESTATLRHASLEDAVLAARSEQPLDTLGVVCGELRSPDHCHLLPGTLSARTYLKEKNVRAEWLLEKYAEPLAAVGLIVGTRAPEARPLLAYAWKLLLKNHPHDSICGCSIDAVHREMETRLGRVVQIAQKLRDEQLAALFGETDEYEDDLRQGGIGIWNPHPFAHEEPVELELLLDAVDGGLPSLCLVDANGAETPFDLLAAKRTVRIVNRTPLYPKNVPAYRVGLRIQTPLPALGIKSLFLHAGKRAPPNAVAEVRADTVETDLLRVDAIPGGFRVTDKQSGGTFVHRLEDCGDRGDEYNFDPVESSPAVTSDQFFFNEEGRVVSGRTFRTLTQVGLLRVPARLAPTRDRREGESVDQVVWSARIAPGSRRVDFSLELAHTAKDHRIRARFDLPEGISAAHTDTAFGFVTRRTAPRLQVGPEAPVSTVPMRSRLLLEGPAGSLLLSIATAGLHEAEAPPGSKSAWVTLLRAVGFLSRDDLSTREGDAGPALETFEAQVPGKQVFAYSALLPGGAGAAEEAARVLLGLVPPHAVPLRAASAMTRSFGEIEPLGFGELSAFKPGENEGTVAVRAFVPLPAEACRPRLALHAGTAAFDAFPSNLEEVCGPASEKSPGSLDLGTSAGVIKTFVLRLRGPGP